MDNNASFEYYRRFKTPNRYLDNIGSSFTGHIPIVLDVPKDVKNLKMLPTDGCGKAKPIFLFESI